MGERVFVTRALPDAALETLHEQAPELEVVVWPEANAPSRATLIREAARATALVTLLSDRVDEGVFAEAPALKVVANYAVGFDNIDVDAATRHGVWVTNTPGVLTEATADCAFALLLATARRLVEADAYTRRGAFTGWGPQLLLGADLHGATLGIVGMGRIGRAVARRARGFGMRILYCSRSPLTPDDERSLDVRRVDLDALLRESDFVSLHVPGGPATTRLIGAPELAKMKSSAILVNTARGSVVDEAALVEAIRAGRLAGAGLDVYEAEPALAPGLAALERVVLVPHIGSATEGTRSTMAQMVARNVVAVLSGAAPPNAVNDPSSGKDRT